MIQGSQFDHLRGAVPNLLDPTIVPTGEDFDE